ncbi:MAG TPA: NYN domain-containing protein [Candidatus Limnocylindrales bacterium]
MNRTNYYVDGFNLFRRALEHGPNRWLDLAALFGTIFPDNEIHHIHYFTSWISGSSNPGKLERQALYIRALETIPTLTPHYGEFHRNPVVRPLVRPIAGLPDCVEVWDTKEKGSDVNLASMLLLDAHNKEFDSAVVVSNDSDLLLPIKLVVTEFHKPVGVLDPAERGSRSLAEAASFYRRLHRGALAKSQFPVEMTDRHGPFRRPARWNPPPVSN